MHILLPEPFHGKITRHYSRYCAVAFCCVTASANCRRPTCPGHDVKLHPHRVNEILSNRVCGIWLGIGEGVNVIIIKNKSCD